MVRYKPIMRPQYSLKVFITAVLVHIPRNIACIHKETGLLRLRARKSLCCFQVLNRKMYSTKHSYKMIKKGGILQSFLEIPHACNQIFKKPYGKTWQTWHFPKLIDHGTSSYVISCCHLSFFGCQESEASSYIWGIPRCVTVARSQDLLSPPKVKEQSVICLSSWD